MKTKPNSSLVARYLRRRAARGAAMVEGALVVLTCIVFWGTIRVVHASASAKLELKAVTRNNAFSLAAKNCQGGDKAAANANAFVETSTTDNGQAVTVEPAVDTGTGGQVADQTSNGADNQTNAVAGGGGASSYMASSIADARPLRNPVKVSDIWKPDANANTMFAVSVQAKSFVACNEESRGGDLGGFIQYVAQNVQTLQDALSQYQ